MSVNKQTENQEDLQKELKLLIDRVKDGYKIEGKKVTQGDMAKMLGKNDKYLTHLVNGHEAITLDQIILFKEKFKKYLPDEKEELKADIAVLQSSVSVLLREVSKLKSEIHGDKEAKDYLQELAGEISLDEVGRKMQKG